MKLSKSKFGAWLSRKRESDVVGRCRSPSCPIINFYHEACGCEVLIFEDVNSGGYIIDRGYNRRRLPQWAERFVFAVDGDSDTHITARHALEILRADT